MLKGGNTVRRLCNNIIMNNFHQDGQEVRRKHAEPSSCGWEKDQGKFMVERGEICT